MKWNTYGLFAITIAFLVCLIVYGTSTRITPGLEWATVFYQVNFYSVMSFTNPFYESIHLPAKTDSSKNQIQKV